MYVYHNQLIDLNLYKNMGKKKCNNKFKLLYKFKIVDFFFFKYKYIMSILLKPEFQGNLLDTYHIYLFLGSTSLISNVYFVCIFRKKLKSFT